MTTEANAGETREVCPAATRGNRGSFTVEAALIVPLILLLMALFLRWGLMLQKDLREAASGGAEPAAAGGALLPEALGGGLIFRRGGPPARRIRDTDLLMDLAYGIKEYLPSWF
ncbi:MAG: pilus assembly protein [Clostridiales bacterium]|nr:pilus assembly protein [Clostridiales bacterium]